MRPSRTGRKRERVERGEKEEENDEEISERKKEEGLERIRRQTFARREWFVTKISGETVRTLETPWRP